MKLAGPKRIIAVRSPGKWLCLLGFVIVGALWAGPAQAQLSVTEARDDAAPFDWRSATPESQGMSGPKLDALKEALVALKTKAFLIIRNDRIVYEWYADDHGPTKTHGTASLAKAVVGGLSLAVALTDGRIGLDDPAVKFIPEWRTDPQKSRITIRQLGSHTSGLSDAEQDGLPHNQLTGWKGDFWKGLPPPNDAFTVARDQTPVLFEPGTRLQYSNPGIGMLTYAVTASLRDAPQKDIRTLLRDRVMRPIGVPDKEWAIGYGRTPLVDGLPLVASWGGGAFTARAFARVGRLVLREGDWDGKRILSKEAVRQITRSAGLPGDCGMGWWTNVSGRYAKVPKDAVWGAGAGDQVLFVVPSLNLIMVRNGQTLVPPPKDADTADVFTLYHDGRAKVLFDPLIEAVTSPYPPSPVISDITWAPKETIVRAARDSDIWATTWADDGHLYTAYGDGTGFEPKLPEKVSLGVSRVEGNPEHFTGINIRSASIEQKGDGSKGKKPSGLLMVGGVLYLWVRNAGNAQLAWSADHGQKWTWADWKLTSGFGCPTFLNFGPNYAGARDGFVYVYSHDSDSAYRAADRVTLARVPKGRIRERDAYEFFTGIDRDGSPLWSSDIGARGAVFTNSGKCYRATVSYNPGLKRYLLCQAGSDRYSQTGAGFGVFDAPEPWGPWTTVTYEPVWDVNPGETCSVPTKWMSADGKTLHLLFSGDDSFSVRRANLTTADERGR
jgi:CubicO group peptidase (beta-lactamase class C family)